MVATPASYGTITLFVAQYAKLLCVLGCLQSL